MFSTTPQRVAVKGGVRCVMCSVRTNNILARSVLTRAELDALPLDNNVKEDVERGKVRHLQFLVL